MDREFRAQGTWLGCNGLAALFALTGFVLAGLVLALAAASRTVAEIERAASAARLTESRDA